MECKLKADEIPYHAQRLYIKLYCERKRDKSKKTIREAKESWNLLGNTKKNHFYKTSAHINLSKYAHGLSNTETFLKEKHPRNQDRKLDKSQCSQDKVLGANETMMSIVESSVIENVTETLVDGELIDGENKNDSIFEAVIGDNNQEAERDVSCEPTLLNEINETSSNDGPEAQNDTISNQESSGVVVTLEEPTPPTVKVGKDLYEMIKAPEAIDWKDLTKKERCDYNSAVRTLKRQYIKKYTIYLESLNQQQLFDHYMKTLY